jgi:hypothetical protein
MFEDCTADLNLVIFNMDLWTAGTQKNLACQLTGLSTPTKITVYNFLRVTCRRYLKNNPQKLGGRVLYARLMKVCSHTNQSNTRQGTENREMCKYAVYLLLYIKSVKQ